MSRVESPQMFNMYNDSLIEEFNDFKVIVSEKSKKKKNLTNCKSVNRLPISTLPEDDVPNPFFRWHTESANGLGLEYNCSTASGIICPAHKTQITISTSTTPDTKNDDCCLSTTDMDSLVGDTSGDLLIKAPSDGVANTVDGVTPTLV